MRLILATLVLAVAVGIVAGGRLPRLARLRVRLPAAAIVGLALQLAPAPGRFLPLALLCVSFVLLLAFATANIRTAGFPLIFVGIVLNLIVIAVDLGMPVTRHALLSSNQLDTLGLLIREGGAKHHLATSADRLLFLGDVIPLRPIRQAVSVGDLFTHAGVAWLIVAGMLGRSAATGGEVHEGETGPRREVERVG